MSQGNFEEYYPESRHEARGLIKSFKGSAQSIRNGLAAILREWRRNQTSRAYE